MNRKPFLVLLALLLTFALSGCYTQSVQTLGTPIPTQIRATPPQMASLNVPPSLPLGATPAAGQPCRVHALDLIGAWVAAQTPESDPFPFTDLDGATCQATFAKDVQPLFNTANIWYNGAPPCTACHYDDVKTAWAQMDLSSYQAILAGSRRASPEAKGNNILGPDWTKSLLFTNISTGRMPPGHPPVTNNPGPVILAGSR